MLASSNTTNAVDAFNSIYGVPSGPKPLGQAPEQAALERYETVFNPNFIVQPNPEVIQNNIVDTMAGQAVESLLQTFRGVIAIPRGAERLIAATLNKVDVNIPEPMAWLQHNALLAEQITRETFGLDQNKFLETVNLVVGGIMSGSAGLKALNYSKPIVLGALGMRFAPALEAIAPQQLLFAGSAMAKTTKVAGAAISAGALNTLFEAGAFPNSDTRDLVMAGGFGLVLGGGLASRAVRKGTKLKTMLGLAPDYPDEMVAAILHGTTDVPERLSKYLAQLDADDGALRAVAVFEQQLDDQALAATAISLSNAGRKNITGAVRGLDISNEQFMQLHEAFPHYRFELVPEEGLGNTLLYGLAPVMRPADTKAVGFLTDSAIDFYQRNGFMLGQRVAVAGQEGIIAGLKESQYLIQPPAGGVNFLIDKADVTFFDDVAASFGSGDLFNKFSRFRESYKGTWEEAIRDFTKGLPNFDAALAKPLRNFMAQQEVRIVNSRITPSARADLARFREAVNKLGGGSPEQAFEQSAASRGMMVTRVSGGRVKLTNTASGDTRLFSNQGKAQEYLTEYRGPAGPDLTPDMEGTPAELFDGAFRAGPPPNPSMPPDFEGRGILEALSGARDRFVEGMIRGPMRLAQLAEDRGQDFEKLLNQPVWTQGMQPVSLGATRAMNRASPYLERLRHLVPMVKPERREVLRSWLTSELKDVFEKTHQMSAQEIAAARGLRKLYNDLFDDFSKASGLELNADNWFRNYAPDVQEYIDTTGSVEGFERLWTGRGTGLPAEITFFGEMFKSGELSHSELDDIFALTVKSIRGGFFKAEAGPAFEQAVQFAKTVKDQDVQEFLVEYLLSVRGNHHLTRQQLARSVQDTLNGVGVSLSPADANSLIDDLWAMNAGALMGYRAGVVARNYTQPLQLLAPLLPNGFARVTRAMVTAGKESNKAYAEAIGAIRKQVPIARAEIVDVNILGTGIRKGMRGIARAGLKPYAHSEDWTRTVAAIAVRDAVDGAYAAWQAGKGTLNEVAKAGILHFQDAPVRAEFHRLLDREGIEAARDFAAREAANLTNFLYGSANAPQWVRTAFGRWFGNYSTHPMGYANWARRVLGTSQLSDRVSAIAKHGSLNASLYAMRGLRINLISWIPFASPFYTGGPFTQAAVDTWTVMNGASQAVRGHELPPDYNIALERLPSHLKLFVPGSTLWSTDVKRAADALDSGTPGLAILEALGIRTVQQP